MSGTVNSFAQKLAIDSLVKSVPQVEAVDNQLQVLVPAIRPGVLMSEIQNRLGAFDSLQYFQPRVVVEQDHVILSGFVPDGRLKRELGLIVSEIPGVRLVTNNLVVLNDYELVEVRGFLREQAVRFAAKTINVDAGQLNHIDAVVTVLNSFENERATLVVRGYSNDADDFYENLRLSKLRAHNVVQVLKRKGISEKNIIVLTYGERYPRLVEETRDIKYNFSRVEFDLLLGR